MSAINIDTQNIDTVAGTTGLVGYSTTYISLQAVNGIFINGIGKGNTPPALPFSGTADANGFISEVESGDFYLSGRNEEVVLKSGTGQKAGSLHIDSQKGDVTINCLNGQFNTNQGSSIISTTGDSTITTNGNTTTTTYGNLNATTHGNATIMTYGNSAAVTMGNVETTVNGTLTSVVGGNLLNVAAGAQENINFLDLLNLCVGAQENINFIELLNLCIGLQQNINLGGLLTVAPTKNHVWGVETVNAGATLKDVGSKIEAAGTHIKTAATSLYNNAMTIFT
ncbi:MAG: hypothetical protein M0T83_01790 [Nitrospiraceae bacterium]|nr:hypothetical protein [Nitrospiraceae bacterium]